MLKTLERLQQARETRHNDKGFTLIELLIVIVVLGILAGVVIFGVAQFQNDAKTSACTSDVKNVGIAEQAWYAKNNAYTATISDLVNGGYLKTTPTTPITVNATTGAVSSTACSTTA